GVLRIDNDDVVFALGKPVCGDGTIEGGEKCGEPGLPECPDGYVCENCKCIAPEESTPQSDEEMAWGVNRIDADHVWAETWDQTTLPVTKADANTGQGIKVAIIDSGIDLDHPDLRVAGGYNAINFRKSYNDDFRHGTHVAGIVAALDNEIGVIGTAPNVELYAVKVLNRRGIGFASDIIDGLQWCIDKKIQVANMSIGSSGSSTSYHDAIIAASDAGITIVAAAGNYGLTDGKIVWPARWPETIAVSATDDYDNLAYFPGWWGSSYGEEVDLAAPGALINSTWNDGYYHLGSGTSMATPHLAGCMALVLEANPALSPAQVDSVLEVTALDLGDTGKDNVFGAGRVQVYEAVLAALNVGIDGSTGSTPESGLILSVAGSNPSFGSLMFDLYTGVSTDMEISIFDITGRKVAIIQNGSISQGNHSFTWSVPGNIGNGIYFLRASSDQGSVSERFTLLR
ncbi:S8 family serine peptidase, partial [bacterium]|nr:S8 family serine peptidase [bacterium]